MKYEKNLNTLEKKIKDLEGHLRFKEREVENLKSVFLANISHEIRTPMNAIVGFSSLLKDPGFTADEKDEFIDEIIKSSSHLTDLIEDVIEVANLQFNKKIQSKTEQIKPQILLQEIFEEYQLKKGSIYKGQIELKIIPSKGPKNQEFNSNPRILHKILKNLIDNAFKFTKSGHIELGYEFKKGYIEFQVGDTGIGIASDRLSKIYSNFSRLWHRDGEVLYEGLGIGLSTAKNFIDILGGIIQVQSEENRGTTFYFSIPLKMDSSPLTIEQVDKKDPYKLLP